MAVLQDEGETPNVFCTVCRKLSDKVDTDKTINFSQKSLSDPGIKKRTSSLNPGFLISSRSVRILFGLGFEARPETRMT